MVITISLTEDYFWSYVLWRTKDLFVRELARLSIDETFVQVGGQRHEAHFAQPEIGQFNMPHGGNEQVVRFQIAVNDAVTVQVLDGQDHLSKIQTGHVTREWTHVLRKGKQKKIWLLYCCVRQSPNGITRPWRHFTTPWNKTRKLGLLVIFFYDNDKEKKRNIQNSCRQGMEGKSPTSTNIWPSKLCQYKTCTWISTQNEKNFFFFFKISVYLEESGAIASFDVFHHHTQVLLRLETALETDDERVVGEAEDVAFGESLFDLVTQEQVAFVDLLHGEPLARFAVAHQIDGPVGTVRYQLDHFVITLLGQMWRVCRFLLFRRRRRHRRVSSFRRFWGRTILLQLAQILLEFGQRIAIQAQLGDYILREIRNALHLQNSGNQRQCDTRTIVSNCRMITCVIRTCPSASSSMW